MKSSNSILRLSLIVMLLATVFSSCVKKDYDEPDTANVDPNIIPNTTIAELQAMATGSAPMRITSDVIISGIIVGDDESGNLYKEIIMEDSTGGLGVLVDLSNYNTVYPKGRRLFIKCKDLYIGNDGDGNFQLGTLNIAQVGRIPAGNLPQYLFKGQWGLPTIPTLTTLNAPNIKTNTLVQVYGVEFKAPDNGVPFVNGSDYNTTLTDCSGNTMIVYTSSYSDFATTNTPNGKGTFVGIYKKYSGDGELILLSLNDLKMDSVRCDSSTGVLTLMPIDSLRMGYAGTTTTCPVGKKIRGIVISDNANSNTTGRNMVVQDGTAGIVVRFTANHAFALGTEVEVSVSGNELSEFNGLLQVNNVALGSATIVGAGSVTPRVATIADIQANFEAWESTLVTILNTTISGSGATYSGTRTLTDPTGTINLFTYSSASFSGATYPTTPVSVTGIIGEYSTATTPNNRQISMRNISDVQ